MQIQEVMTPKAIPVDVRDSVQQAAAIMARENMEAVPVVGQGKLIGMVSGWDIAVRVVAQQKEPASTPVADALSGDFHYCFVGDDCQAVLRTMDQLQVLRLPVVDPEKVLVGMVTMEALSPGGDSEAARPVEDNSSKLDEALEETFPASDPISPP
ncbi:MAG: CBS domain-containing protein [Halomonadaceae bacterium]|nr:MAG: CBS domain-containing protein [Halomonadaceae bacterium]